jgi:hypothetical protein
MDPSLEDSLLNVSAQNRLLLTGAEALHIISTAGSADTCLIGSREPPQRKVPAPGGNAVTRVFASIAERAPIHTPSETLSRVAGFVQAVASSAVDDITRTWCVLSILLLLPRARSRLLARTAVYLAPYILGDGGSVLPFDARLSEKMLGTKDRQAMTPIEVVVSEWQLLELLRSRPRA